MSLRWRRSDILCCSAESQLNAFYSINTCPSLPHRIIVLLHKTLSVPWPRCLSCTNTPPGTCSMKILMYPFSETEPKYWTMFLCFKYLWRAISSWRGWEYLIHRERKSFFLLNLFRSIHFVKHVCSVKMLHFFFRCLQAGRGHYGNGGGTWLGRAFCLLTAAGFGLA